MPDNTSPAKPSVAVSSAGPQNTGSSSVHESKSATVPQEVSPSKNTESGTTKGKAPIVPVQAPPQSSKPAAESVIEMMENIKKEKATMSPEQKKERYMKLYGTPDSPWDKGVVDLSHPDLEYESQPPKDQ